MWTDLTTFAFNRHILFNPGDKLCIAQQDVQAAKPGSTFLLHNEHKFKKRNSNLISNPGILNTKLPDFGSDVNGGRIVLQALPTMPKP